MTVTRDRLRCAALASDDAADRLVYADWLEQHGEIARAQLIHLQCEHARTARHEFRRRELEWLIEAVLGDLGESWRDELPVLDGVEWLELSRGFASTVRVRDVATLVANADAIIAAAPSVTCVELQRLEADAQVEPMPWLRTLRVRGPMGSSTAMLSVPAELELAADPYGDLDWLARDGERPLERLTVTGSTTVGIELARMLANASWASELTTLELATGWVDDNSGYNDDPRLGDGGARELQRLTRLEVLTLDRQRIGTKAVERLLAGLPELRELSARECGVTAKVGFKKATGAPLERLDLSRNPIGSQGAQAIAAVPRFAALQRLELDTCEIEAAGLATLMRAPLWNSLRWLDLSRNPLGLAGARTLAEAPRPAQLWALVVADVDFEDAAGAWLAKVPWLGELAHLDLSGNPLRGGASALRSLRGTALRSLAIGSIGLQRTEAAALARFWPELVHLDVANNPLTDAGLERFATMKEARRLQALRVADCQLRDDGLELLAQGARCPQLRSLDLAGNKFGATALAAFLRAPVAQRLARLDLARCDLDADAIAMLARTPLPPALRGLNLRGIELDERTLLALADSPTLRAVPELLLDGNPWTFHPKARERLAERFGPTWYQHDE